MIETHDIDAIRQTAGTEGWRLLVAAMLERDAGERTELYQPETPDQNRRDLIMRHAGRNDVLAWFQDQIERAATRRKD